MYRINYQVLWHIDNTKCILLTQTLRHFLLHFAIFYPSNLSISIQNGIRLKIKIPSLHTYVQSQFSNPKEITFNCNLPDNCF